MAEVLHHWYQVGYGLLVPYQFGMPTKLDPPPTDRWLRVSGGDLPVSIMIRVDRADDGRFVVSGLLVGREESERREITWQTLRSIRLNAILEERFRDFDPLQPGTWDGDRWVSLWEDFVRPAQTVDATSGRGPSRDDLAKFARTYLKHKASQPHRAMTAAAKELSISRATAIRRAAAARKEGLLP